MRAVLCALTALMLTACAGGDRSSRDLESGGDGPDEFSVVPGATLELPETLDLPSPTPGDINLADATPIADAVAALGGRAVSAGGIPAADRALIAFASRNGTQDNIRAALSQEDAVLRARGARFSLNPFRGGDRYFAVYARQALDAYAELERFRAAGVATPSAPPDQ